LASLSKLQNLTLRYAEDLENDALQHIVNLPLQMLNLSYTKITNQALQYVNKLALTLEKLYLNDTTITIRGIKEILHPMKMTKLRILLLPCEYAKECAKSRKFINMLEKAGIATSVDSKWYENEEDSNDE
jgi:hypothetical protein